MKTLFQNLMINLFNIDTFRFVSPAYLIFIPLLIILFYFFNIRKNNKNTDLFIIYSNIKFFKDISQSLKLQIKKNIIYLKLLAIIILIIGLARPQTGNNKTEIIQHGIDMILSVDVSLSMSAIDMDIKNKRTRLDVVKDVLNDFIISRKGDRLGVVIYGTNSFTLVPLTTDYKMLENIVNNIEIAMAGPRTNISKSIVVSLNRLRDSDAKEQIIILLTDGKHNVEGIPLEQSILAAKTLNIKIYSIGFGNEGVYPWKLTDPATGKIYYRNQQAEIDFEMLKHISKETGGKFYKAHTIEDLKNVYNDINELEKSEIIINEWTDYRELFRFFLIIGFLIIIVAYLLDNIILHTIP